MAHVCIRARPPRACGLTLPSSGPPTASVHVHVKRHLKSTMAKILFEVDARGRATLFAKLTEQAALRAQHGELGFNVQVDDNARHICYIFLDWESLSSAHRFLESRVSHDLVSEWPIEKVLGAIPLCDLGEQILEIEAGRT